MNTSILLLVEVVGWTISAMGVGFLILLLYDYVNVFKKYGSYRLFLVKKRWVKYLFALTILLFIVSWIISFNIIHRYESYIDTHLTAKYMIFAPYLTYLLVATVSIWIVMYKRLKERRLVFSIRDCINLDGINNPLVKYLADKAPPEECFRHIGESLFFHVFTIQPSCVLRYVKNILSRYKIVNACLERARNLEEYETCVRNIEKYGDVSTCYDYLLNEELYRDCVSG